MKKLYLVSAVCFAVVLSAPVFAASGGFDIKAGAGSIKGAGDKTGFDAGLGYAIRLDRFFAVMPEVNFNWLSYTGNDASIGGAGVTGSSTPSTNIYTLPLMLNGRIYIPMGSDDVPIFQPYITVGAGYGWSSYVQGSTPTSSSATATLSGFMYQASIGGALNLGMITDGSPSTTSIILEIGYRGGQLATSDSKNLDYSGYTARAGVSLSL